MSETPASPDPAAQRRKRVVLVLFLLVLLGIGGRFWWRSHNFEETDNAYVEGDITIVSPRVAGVVTKIFVNDNQHVKAGDRLLELDPTDYAVRVDGIRARMREVDAELASVDAQIEQGQADVLSVSAAVGRARAQVEKTRREAERQGALFGRDEKAISRSEVDSAVAARDGAQADLAAQEAQVKVAQAKIAASRSARLAARARGEALAAQLKDADLQRGYTEISAPVGGRVGKRNVEVGAHVQAGQKLIGIVQDGVWVVANFKEVQLRGLHPGQKASVRVDAFPDREVTARIDSIAPASGAQFTLLPPDNATGNFTKIVQRVPVKITFETGSLGDLAGRIVPGMSVLVEIDLRQGKPGGSGQ